MKMEMELKIKTKMRTKTKIQIENCPDLYYIIDWDRGSLGNGF